MYEYEEVDLTKVDPFIASELRRWRVEKGEGTPEEIEAVRLEDETPQGQMRVLAKRMQKLVSVTEDGELADEQCDEYRECDAKRTEIDKQIRLDAAHDEAIRMHLLACEDPETLSSENTAALRGIIVDQLFARGIGANAPVTRQVKKYLLERLLPGPAPATDLVRGCAEHTGASERMVFHVRDQIGLRSIPQQGDRRKRMWDLPDHREMPEPHVDRRSTPKRARKPVKVAAPRPFTRPQFANFGDFEDKDDDDDIFADWR